MSEIKELKNLAIIPARGGSKRIPRKNVKLFNGKPIIQYSITCAIDSKCFNEIMVSTDDKEIADIAVDLGAKVPFFRSEKTSNDFAGIAEVVNEVLAEYEKHYMKFENICVILPTAPFITEDNIKRGFKKIISKDVEAAIAVVKYSYPIQRSLVVKGEYIKMNWPENYHKRSQDLEQTFHDAGQFYWIKTEDFLKQGKFFTDRTSYVEIPESQVQDIDTEEDWKIAEIKYRILYEL